MKLRIKKRNQSKALFINMEIKEREAHYQIHNKLNLAIFNVGVND